MVTEEYKPIKLTEPPRSSVVVNKQLFENSQLKQEYPQGMRDPLRGVSPPTFAIQREKPEHRIILLLKLKGMSNREISKETGYTESWITQITHQPWFQDMLVEKIAEAGDNIVENLISLEAKNSMFTLIKLRDDPQQAGAVRAACAKDVLDRYLGKPVQRSENLNVNVNREDRVTRLDAVNDEIAQLEAEIRELTAPRK